MNDAPMSQPDDTANFSGTTTLFLCGDVMLGRGVDQILPHPADPEIFESYARCAGDYVSLAERVSGPIARPVGFDYVWGDALDILELMRPSARIINLETAITADGEPARAKGIQYRMHPANVPSLAAAGIDCCALANNHVLDWGTSSLLDTLDSLAAAKIAYAGAGRNDHEAAAAAEIAVAGTGRVLVFSFGLHSSGIPASWRARAETPGINLLGDLSHQSAEAVAHAVTAIRRRADLVIASLHWGGNWGFAIDERERIFARLLIDLAGVDIVHGHSSHHIKQIEVYRDRLILYGCGDLLNDYEGIGRHGEFRGDLGLMYFPTLEQPGGRLVRLAMAPTTVRRLRIARAPEEGVTWLSRTLNRVGRDSGTSVRVSGDGMLELAWQ